MVILYADATENESFHRNSSFDKFLLPAVIDHMHMGYFKAMNDPID